MTIEVAFKFSEIIIHKKANFFKLRIERDETVSIAYTVKSGYFNSNRNSVMRQHTIKVEVMKSR